MKVCIAEKPSVAGEIAKIIGASTRKQGYFEGNGYQVTWTFGHFCTLKEPGDYSDKYLKWDLYSLPVLPEEFQIKLIEDPGVQKQFRVIEELMKGATEVINCGDAGQEGELIQRWVLEHANCTAPIKRLWISSLTTEAIKEGFKNLMKSEDFDSLFEAGKCRAIGDWLYGINATRLFTLKHAKNKQVLSVGRVQTPTLALIVKRHFEIKNFVPKVYYELKTRYRDTLFTYEKGKFESKMQGAKALEHIKEHELVIKTIAVKKGKEHPPNLFDLTSLQVEANNKFGWSADATLKNIQNLYEKKLVTYPRVDTVFLPNDQYPKIKGIFNGLKDYYDLLAPLKGKKIKKSKKVFNDKKVTDHHAIIPTGVHASAIGGDEQKLYKLITLKFIAAFYPECLVSNSTVKAAVGKLSFKATGRQILEMGWRAVYDSGKSEQENTAKKNLLPNFEKGESGRHDPLFEEKFTNPPKEYTEATLLRAMETAGRAVDDEELQQIMKDNGIGRPSTRANIIETLFRRKYIEKNKKKLLPTSVGIKLIQLIENPTLKSPALTGQWEKKLREIEDNKYSSSDFIKEMKELVTNLTDEVRMSNPAHTKIRCPKCEMGSIVKGKQAYGCTDWKNGCDFTVPFQIENVLISDKKVGELIQQKQLPIQENINLILDHWFTTQLIKEQAPCPKCKKGIVKKGKTAWGCSMYNNGCDYLVAF
ncbi:MAG: DNA topoisomerase-3 [Saprospiraceae bacterium]|jgi:DNA topoisomerase-3